MRVKAAFACLITLVSRAPAQQSDADIGKLIDRTVTRQIPAEGPGCTVGVAQGGTRVLKAYGGADLERGIPLSPGSILEAGSVSKQFTAAAVTLLAIDGKLTFDDDVRRWFPELPDYGSTITIRHLLTHTSGLRDWGNMAGMEGWPRGTRAHSNEDALAITARQKSLNYPPGSAYSYTNTGYNLLAMLVQRASGKTLAQFTKERLFDPLGMRNTSWRDEYERVVRGRALAYEGNRTPITTAMPNEDAYGNGGLLTTVEDLLIWNDAMRDAKLGRALADSVVKRMVLTNGKPISYALGLFIVPNARETSATEIQHSGSTAGYRAHLLRLTEPRLSVAVLCNGGNATNASLIANQITDSLLKRRGRGTVVIWPLGLDSAQISQFAGLWANEARHSILRTTHESGTIRRGTTNLSFAGNDTFRDGGTSLHFQRTNGRLTHILSVSAEGDTTRLNRVEAWRPTATELAAFAGTYSTPEVHGEPFVVSVDGTLLVLRQGPRTRTVMLPTYKDNFAAGGRLAWFTRDASGRVTALHLAEDRAWDVQFLRN